MTTLEYSNGEVLSVYEEKEMKHIIHDVLRQFNFSSKEGSDERCVVVAFEE
jgi:hypothetical protein